MKFVKKPVEVEAVQYLPENAEVMLEHLEGCRWEMRSEGIVIHTLEGEMLASPGDWIIKGVQGEVYPCRPDIFEQTYTQVGAPLE